MTQKTRTLFSSDKDTALPDNLDRQITPATLRAQFQHLVDSALLDEDGARLVAALNAVLGSSVWQSTSSLQVSSFTTTGTINPRAAGELDYAGGMDGYAWMVQADGSVSFEALPTWQPLLALGVLSGEAENISNTHNGKVIRLTGTAPVLTVRADAIEELDTAFAATIVVNNTSTLTFAAGVSCNGSVASSWELPPRPAALTLLRDASDDFTLFGYATEVV